MYRSTINTGLVWQATSAAHLLSKKPGIPREDPVVNKTVPCLKELTVLWQWQVVTSDKWEEEEQIGSGGQGAPGPAQADKEGFLV